jgi:hypothetical protein
MSLLDTASLIVTPNGYKEGTLYSVIPSDGSGDMSVVRATTATRVNSSGLVELVPYNLIRRSEEFNLIWSPVRSSITANSTTAPNGTLTADTLIDDTNNNIHYIAQTFTAINGAATISVYAKANQISQIQLIAQQGTTPMGRGFDLATGTVFTESVGGVSSNDLGQSITDVGNGWYRCEMSWTSTGQNEFWILLSVSNAATFTGTGANGVYIWGAQAVEGSTALPYQKTETRLNIPRLDYSNGTCPSLLVEPQRTNLISYSEQFDNALWASANATVSANSTTSPNGTQNADLIYPSSSGSNLGLYQTTAGVTGVVGTVSCYVKSAGKNWALLGTDNTSPYNVSFDLVNGVVGSLPSGYTATITNVGNGWFRITATFQSGSSLQYPFVGVADNTNRSVTPNGTDGIFVWGFQAEQGNYVSSYIPTTSASVTRNADVISKTGISSLIGQTEGTLFWEGEIKLGESSRLLFVSDGTFTNFINTLVSASGEISAVIRFATINSTEFTSSALTAGVHKIAFAYKANDSALYIDGVSISGTSGADVPATSRLDIGSRLGSDSFLNSEINAAALYKTRLTNAELATLTTI